MALRAAVASGNWSNPAIWNGGVLPNPGDVVASNGFTVTINQNINVDSITNAAQAVVGAVPDMTSATTPSGIVTASQSETGLRAAFNAFGGDFNTEWWPSGAAWIAYEFPTPKAIDQYTVGTYGGTGSWTFEGWNGSTWIVLHTVVNTSFGYTSPLIGNSVAYIKYRLNYNPSAPGRLHTIQFYEYLGTSAAVAVRCFHKKGIKKSIGLLIWFKFEQFLCSTPNSSKNPSKKGVKSIPKLSEIVWLRCIEWLKTGLYTTKSLELG